MAKYSLNVIMLDLELMLIQTDMMKKMLINVGVSQNHNQSQPSVQNMEVIAFAMVLFSRCEKVKRMEKIIISLKHLHMSTQLLMPTTLKA